MIDKIKMGVIGCRVGRAWVAGARAGADTIAWALADLDRDLARRVAEEHEVAKVYGDYRELLADDEVEAVGVATAPDVRKPMVIEALEAGKHVLVQKPHGRNAADVAEINAVAASTGKTLVYSYFMRHQAENKENRQIIAAGRIGRVYHARVHYHYRETTIASGEPIMSRRRAGAGYIGGVLRAVHWANTVRTTSIRLGFCWVVRSPNGPLPSAIARFQRP